MKHLLAVGSAGFLIIPTLGPLRAQATSGGSLNEGQLYSLYAARHAATVQFAELATARGSDGDVRKHAATLARANQAAADNLRKVARDRHLTLVPPAHDTTTMLLARATDLLRDKTGRAFDSTWVSLAYDWLSTLILDNNTHVKKQLSEASLETIARAHTSWLLPQSVEVAKLKKKFT